MAVSLTVEQLLQALRLGTSDQETDQAKRLLAYATEAVTRHVPGEIPDAISNEAVIRLSGYLFDQPFSPRGPMYANALRNSGAASAYCLTEFTGAGSVEGAIAAAQQAIGTPGNPVWVSPSPGPL